MSRRVCLVAVVVVACGAWGVQAVAQTAISADGVVESKTGGFKFPDGTVQATAAAGGAPVEDTGQTTCFAENGDPRDCSGTGEDGEFQAGVEWPTPRFTDNGDGTVTDDLTGLIWLKDANCPEGAMTWQEALDWVASLNTSGACTDYTAMTFTDWRLGNVKELDSLIDFGRSSPSLPFPHPFVDVQIPDGYWSSTSRIVVTDRAWFIGLEVGGVNTAPKGAAKFVWPVRGGE